MADVFEDGDVKEVKNVKSGDSFLHFNAGDFESFAECVRGLRGGDAVVVDDCSCVCSVVNFKENWRASGEFERCRRLFDDSLLCVKREYLVGLDAFFLNS